MLMHQFQKGDEWHSKEEAHFTFQRRFHRDERKHCVCRLRKGYAYYYGSLVSLFLISLSLILYRDTGTMAATAIVESWISFNGTAELALSIPLSKCRELATRPLKSQIWSGCQVYSNILDDRSSPFLHLDRHLSWGYCNDQKHFSWNTPHFSRLTLSEMHMRSPWLRTIGGFYHPSVDDGLYGS